jgi:hypothetical protein
MFMPYRTLMPDGTVDESFVEKEQTDALQGPSGNKTPLIVSAFTQNQRDELRELGHLAGALSGEGTHQTNYLLTSSAEASPAKTSPSPENAKDSPATAPASSTSSHESSRLFDPEPYSWRTFPASSPRTAVGTSESCLERWPTSGTAWHGGLSTAATSECRSDAAGCSSSECSLTGILEPPQNVPAKYSLSARAATGILRRAQKRGRTLPSHLSAALEAVAQTTTTDRPDGS